MDAMDDRHRSEPLTGGALGARIERVAGKLRAAREGGLKPFGAESHGMRVKPPLPEADVAAFEARHGVRLPEEYRAFITRVGDGGAGPAYGMYSLEKALTVERKPLPDGFLRTPFTHAAGYDPVFDPAWEDVWEAVERGELAEEEADRRYLLLEGGSLVLCHEGCGYLHLLVVTGPARGEMWMDARCSDGGFVPLRATFLDWYERWLDDTLAGGHGTWWLGPPTK